MATQYESRVQNVVYQLEVGLGARILKGALYILFMVLIAVLFMARRHHGFKDARAMEQAQLAVQVAKTGSLNTKVVRPAMIPVLEEQGQLQTAEGEGALESLPDILNEPVYPYLMGTIFKAVGTEFEEPTRFRFQPERWIIIPVNLLFCFASGLLLYLIGYRLFTPRVALTAMTIFFVSGIPFARAIEGTELCLTLFLFTFACWTLLQVIEAWSRPSSSGAAKWIPLILASLALGLLPLTRYAAVAVWPGMFFILFAGLKKKGLVPAIVMLVICLALMGAWVSRNLQVSGLPFGLAPSTAFDFDPADHALRELTVSTDEEDPLNIKAVLTRIVRAVHQAFSFEDSPVGAGIVLCLFVATFFYRFQRRGIAALRWSLLISYMCLTGAAGFFGLEQMEVSFVFYPVVTLLGSAFFYLLLDRLQIQINVVSLGVIAIFILFQALPYLTAMTSPKPYSYPPYHPQIMYAIMEPFEDDELIVTDLPWATAWYGDQLSMHLPLTVQDFFLVHDRYQEVEALYFTLETKNLPYHQQLVQGPYAPWRNIMEGQALPRGFPFTFGLPIQNGEQLIYADRSRFFPDAR